MSESIAMPLDGGTITLLVERPDGASTPTVLVLHEVFGVNNDMRATCRELADRGFLAICPDLYWRIATGFSLSCWSETDLPRINELYRAVDRDRAVHDIAAVLAFARRMSGATGKAGLLGYCMGGLLVFLAAARYGATPALPIIRARLLSIRPRRRRSVGRCSSIWVSKTSISRLTPKARSAVPLPRM